MAIGMAFGFIFLAQLCKIVTGGSVSGTSVAVTPSTAPEGNTPINIQFSLTSTTALSGSSSDSITITASHPIWSATGVVTCTFTPAAGGIFTGGFATTSTTVFVATVKSGKTVNSGQAVVFTCTTNLAAHLTGGTTVTFSMTSTQDTTPVTGITGWTTVSLGLPVSFSGGFVGSDPVAHFGDMQAEFELPVGKLTTLITTDNLEVLCSVFEGAYWNTERGSFQEQWFDRFILKTPQSGLSSPQGRFLDIKIKRDLHEMNMSMIPPAEFFTLDISMGYGSISDSSYVSKVTSDLRVLPFWLLEHDVIIHRFSHTSRSYKSHRIGTIPSECVYVHGSLLEFAMCSRPADYYTGQLRELSVKYAHLDMTILNMKDPGALRGLLPELLGLQPISEFTKSCIKEPLRLATNSNSSSTDDHRLQMT
eukprot:TRINITY_DN28181_c0_g1_i1.p1 TRINITY_DN28181_c0_g1~~TRINITY_DN28181_c0_g1_i1.p1  ORF type:complete len:420 (+),score=33.66 TRINITY_DN28181_c0_g1_i1:88-1347(+)